MQAWRNFTTKRHPGTKLQGRRQVVYETGEVGTQARLELTVGGNACSLCGLGNMSLLTKPSPHCPPRSTVVSASMKWF